MSLGLGVLLFDFAAVMYFRSTAVFIQTTVPQNMLGSWYGAIDFISRFVGMIGILAATRWVDQVGIVPVYGVLMGVVLLSSLRWLRMLRSDDVQMQEE